MGQIAQRLIFDRAPLAIAATEQVGAIDPMFVRAGRGDDVRGAGTCSHRRYIDQWPTVVKLFSDYIWSAEFLPVART